MYLSVPLLIFAVLLILWALSNPWAESKPMKPWNIPGFVWPVLLSISVLGGVWLLWGVQGAVWAAWFIAGPFIVGPAMLALRRAVKRFLGVN